jgi:hypothetical protein
MISWDYPDERVIAWVFVRGKNSEQQRIPWLRDPRTPEELQLSEQARRIIQKAQDQEKVSLLCFMRQNLLLCRSFVGLPDSEKPGVFAIPLYAVPDAVRIPVHDLITGD